MQKYSDVVIDRAGNVLSGATVTVTVSATGAAAVLYSDNGTTQLSSNQVTSDSNGVYSFYAANGRYALVTSYRGKSVSASDVLLFDAEDALLFEISVKDSVYGARGDGTSDDAAAINAALAAAAGTGRRVVLPYSNATYLCGSQIIADRCRMEGDNATLKFTGLSATTDCLVLQGSTKALPLVVEGVHVNANNTGRDAVSVVGGNASANRNDFMRLMDMYIQGAVRDGIHMEPGAANYWIQNSRLADIYIYNPGRHGLAMIVPALSNVFINQGELSNVDIRGAGQTVASSYDIYCDSQGSSGSQKVSEWTLTSCDFDVAGAANHAQGSIYLGMTGSSSGYDGWVFNCVTPEDTGSVITGFPTVVILGAAGVNFRGFDWAGGVPVKFGGVVDLTATNVWGRVNTGSSGRTFTKLDMTVVGFSASFANDAAAAAAGVAIGQLYRNGSAVQVRVV